jgi:sugar transferase (PEP-CTERM/EpsH1 system associated)
MNLLIVSPYLPRPLWGASTRSYHLLKALARQHNVSLLALATPEEIHAYHEALFHPAQLQHVLLLPYQLPSAKRWQQVRTILRGRSYLLHLFLVPAMQAALDEAVNRTHYDAVLFESVLMAGYQLPPSVKILIDQHNIEHELLQRTYQQEKWSLRKWYNWQESRLLKPGELERCRRADLVLVTSEREQSRLQQMLPGQNIEVVPNGVDTEMFVPEQTVEEKAHQIIFTGAMDYHPNIQAVLFFAQQCWQQLRAHIPDATWLIVGRNPPPEVQQLAALNGVTVTGSVADVRPFMRESAVAIAPLQVGSGTRLKILEALAMQKAVVTTRIGCEGLAVESGKHLLVADSPKAFVEAIITLLHSADMRADLGRKGRMLVEDVYSWDQCAAHLLRALETHHLVEQQQTEEHVWH